MRKTSNHRIAVKDCDGNTEIIEADELRVCVPTAACLKFWATIASCIIAMALGTFMMIWGGQSSDLFKVGEALVALASGVLLPGPEYHKVLPKKKKPVRRRRRPAKRTQSAPPGGSVPASTAASAHTSALVEVRIDKPTYPGESAAPQQCNAS